MTPSLRAALEKVPDTWARRPDKVNWAHVRWLTSYGFIERRFEEASEWRLSPAGRAALLEGKG